MHRSKKMGRPLPKWLVDLDPGKYRVSEIVELTGLSRASVSQTLRRHCRQVAPVSSKSGYISVFEWTGKSIKEN